jgi:serine/arginine repetitive matrix protein 1
MSSNFFRGTSAGQDHRFSNAHKRMLKKLKCVDAKLLKQKVDLKKVNFNLIKKWIAERVNGILGFEDDIVISLCINMLESETGCDGKEVQLALTGFLDKEAAPFVAELWGLLVSAQASPSGMPASFLEAKKQQLAAADAATRQRFQPQIQLQPRSRFGPAHAAVPTGVPSAAAAVAVAAAAVASAAAAAMAVVSGATAAAGGATAVGASSSSVVAESGAASASARREGGEKRKERRRSRSRERRRSRSRSRDRGGRGGHRGEHRGHNDDRRREGGEKRKERRRSRSRSRSRRRSRSRDRGGRRGGQRSRDNNRQRHRRSRSRSRSRDRDRDRGGHRSRGRDSPRSSRRR